MMTTRSVIDFQDPTRPYPAPRPAEVAESGGISFTLEGMTHQYLSQILQPGRGETKRSARLKFWESAGARSTKMLARMKLREGGPSPMVKGREPLECDRRADYWPLCRGVQ